MARRFFDMLLEGIERKSDEDIPVEMIEKAKEKAAKGNERVFIVQSPSGRFRFEAPMDIDRYAETAWSGEPTLTVHPDGVVEPGWGKGNWDKHVKPDDSRLVKTEAAGGKLYVVHGEFEGVKPGSLSRAMSKEQAQAFFDDLAGRPHLKIKNMVIIPASKSDPVWKNEAGDDRFDRASEYLIRRGRAVKEAVDDVDDTDEDEYRQAQGDWESELDAKKAKKPDAPKSDEPKVITQLRKIVDESQANRVTDPKTGKKRMVDGTTASVIVSVWDQLPEKYREQFETRIIPMGIHSMTSFAFKITGK